MRRTGFKKISLEEIREKQQLKLLNQSQTSKLGLGKRKASKGLQNARKRSKRGKRHIGLTATLREKVRKKFDYRCQWPGCGIQDRYIDVQHIAKRSQRPDLRNSEENLTCLCREHHNLADNTSEGRKLAKQYGLAGGEAYERRDRS